MCTQTSEIIFTITQIITQIIILTALNHNIILDHILRIVSQFVSQQALTWFGL